MYNVFLYCGIELSGDRQGKVFLCLGILADGPEAGANAVCTMKNEAIFFFIKQGRYFNLAKYPFGEKCTESTI